MDQNQIQQFLETQLIPWGTHLAMALLIAVLGVFLVRRLAKLARRLFDRADFDPILSAFIVSIGNGFLLLFVAIAALSQLGLDTTSLVALIGAAGLAVGLALQDSLKNFASGVLLIIFRPFDSGDFVEAAGIMGVVERVNIFSSTLRTPDNREIIVPNGRIHQGIITNYSARDTRRIDMALTLAFDADIDRAKELIEQLLNDEPRVLEDPAPVVAIDRFSSRGCEMIIRPWVASSDYFATKCDLQQHIHNLLNAQGIPRPATAPVAVSES